METFGIKKTKKEKQIKTTRETLDENSLRCLWLKASIIPNITKIKSIELLSRF